DISTNRGYKFASKVLDFMRDRLVKYQEETGNNYNLEATPAEGTAYRLAMKDKNTDKNIICANEEAYKEGAEPFYTNSTQLPVGHTDNIFEVLDSQDGLQVKYTGGTVIHLFIGEKIDDPMALKKLVKTICETYRLPYFTITPTFSICPRHGYLSGEHRFCPKCDADIEKELEKKK
ncbi:MAG: ribonucleoside triphosphate reductase, partial [Tenericutes bacterium]